MSADPTEIHYRSPAGSESAAASTTAEEQVTATSAEPVVKWFRVVYRIGLVTIWTATMFSLWGIGYLVLYFSENLRLNWRQAIFRTWASMFMKILGATMEVDGSPPEGKFFLVASHLSYMDIPDLASKLDTSFVARTELAGWPVIGALTRAMDTIYVDREDCRDLIGVNE